MAWLKAFSATAILIANETNHAAFVSNHNYPNHLEDVGTEKSAREARLLRRLGGDGKRRIQGPSNIGRSHLKQCVSVLVYDP